MKKYNRVIILSITIYVVLAFLSGNAILSVEDKYNQSYRIESNRIMNKLSDKESLDNINLREYDYISDMQFLDIIEQDKNMIELFFSESNNESYHMVPFYKDNQLLGYIKFVYSLPNLNLKYIFYILQLSLFVLEIFVLIILFYMKKNIVKPFQRLQELPIQLARGHFKGSVKEEKSQYLGRFMWGMGQLKDTLDISKTRQLELVKEKKKMLLSLSHDIKTPLNIIKLYGKALEENVYEDEKSKQHAIHQIGQKTIEIEKYVEEIMKSTRDDVIDIQINNTDFYLQDLIDKVLSIYQEQCSLRQIELIVSPFENKLLKGDIERSQEVFENIFENIFKYGDGRKIEITFSEEDYCQLIRIYNTGVTVSDNEFNHIFDSFFRGSNSDGQLGHGLGLYICREIMTKMDGAIFAEKDKNGMCFVLVFR